MASPFLLESSMTIPPDPSRNIDHWTALPLDTRPLPQRLFHYTTGAGLIGIIQNSCLWATDLRYLNDSGEFNFGHKLALRTIRQTAELRTQEPDYLTKHRQAVFNSWSYDELFKHIGISVGATMRKALFGVACFCEKRDLLSQWRGYGGTLGYSVGFDAQEVRNMMRDEFLPLVPVCYVKRSRFDLAAPSAQQVAALQTVKDYCTQWLDEADALEESNEPPSILKGKTSRSLTVLMMAIAAQLKHESFSEEREWRIGDLQIAGEAKIKFRQGGLGVTPYVELLRRKGRKKSSKPKLLPICEIMVGPGPAMEERTTAVRLLLTEAGYDADTIAIVSSEVPFRSL